METAWYIVKITGVGIGIVFGTLVITFVVWWIFLKEKNEYTRAKDQIFTYVRGYKRKCTGNNRFLVTIESLQDSFREYDTELIKKIWLELVREHVIERDPNDDEWCIR